MKEATMRLIPILLALLLLAGGLHAIDPWGEPLILTGSMTVMAQVRINGFATTPGDVLAAFVSVNGVPELRGKQAITVNSNISGCLIQIYTDANDEEIRFMVWDESSQQVYVCTQALASVVNGIVGSWPSNLYQINVSIPLNTDPWGAPTILSSSMSVMAQVSVNGSGAEWGDILAAFVSIDGTEHLRGKTPILINDGVSGCLLQVYTESSGEPITFKVWDANTQTIYVCPQTLSSVVNGSVGSWPANLYQIDASQPALTDPWGIPTVLSGSMSVMARVLINNQDASNGDVLSAFVDVQGTEQLRGKATVAINANEPGCLIQIFTDSNDETISFKVWDYSAQEIIPVNNILPSQLNAMIGGWPDNLYQINAGPGVHELTNPIFDPPDGYYVQSQTVSISCFIPGAQNYYTLDGSEPTLSSPLYTGPIAVNTSTTIKARAWLAGWSPSAISTAHYTITGQAEAPSFNPAPGTYTAPQNIVISAPGTGLTIRYTLDGSEPGPGSPAYVMPINLAQGVHTLKARVWRPGWNPSPTTTGVYTITGTVAMPFVNPPGGTYTVAQTITISCSTPGSQIRYTTDGSEPNDNSTLYTGPFTVSNSLTLKARGFKADWAPSQTASVVYTITGTVAMPSADPPAGVYTQPVTVSLSCSTPGAVIRYTTNGSNPSVGSTPYTTPILIGSSTPLKAKGFLSGWNASPTLTANYAITGTVATPSFSHPSGTYNRHLTFSIACATPAAQIRYTLDGTDPDSGSALYTDSIYIGATTTVKARGYKTGWEPSEIDSVVYQISLANPDAPDTPLPPGITSAWPNPFTQRITIAVRLKEASPVAKLGIYNLRGECVRSFEAAFIGEYEFEWDGCDQRGRRMPSGIYLLRLKSGRLAQTRKIVFK